MSFAAESGPVFTVGAVLGALALEPVGEDRYQAGSIASPSPDGALVASFVQDSMIRAMTSAAAGGHRL